MCFTLFFHSLVGVDDLTEDMTWKAKYVRCYVYTQSELTRWAWDEKGSLLCIFLYWSMWSWATSSFLEYVKVSIFIFTKVEMLLPKIS